MAIKFFNIKSKEVRVAETEPLISALWASSDHSPNITQGQDFGWRLAPEVVVELEEIKRNPMIIQTIAVRYGVPLDGIGEKEVLQYISDKTTADEAAVASDADYSDEYNAEIRRLQREKERAEEPTTTSTTEVPVTTTTTTENLTITSTTTKVK